jgi:hypothetical protein
MVRIKLPLAWPVGLVLALVATGYCQVPQRSLEKNWNDFIHFTTIGNFDLAKGYAQALVDSNSSPAELFELSQSNPQAYSILQKVHESREDFAEVTGKILELIETGRFLRHTDQAIITEEIKRLSGTARGRLTALKRLRDAGEYAIPLMLQALADPARQNELPNITAALPHIGKDAIRPLAAALQTNNVPLKAEIIRALGQIGYPQVLAHLKYVAEKDPDSQLRNLAQRSIEQIDPATASVPTAELFCKLAESYYYHSDSLAPAQDAPFANIWFWGEANELVRQEVDRGYFYELMAMRCCEWALKADPTTGKAIALWLTAFFKAESTGLPYPQHFGSTHADALTYATTAGPEYLHEALARAVKDKDTYIALGLIEALATTAGEKSLMFRLGTQQPLVDALSFDDRAVKYSAAIAIAAAGPTEQSPESPLVVEHLADALLPTGKDNWDQQMIDSYAERAAKVMLKLAQSRNSIIDLSKAQPVLIDATKDQRTEIRKLAAEILAWLNSPDAQRAIAAMALNQSEQMELRIAAFAALATSAKVNGNLLDDAKIDAVYSLVGSPTTDSTLRSAASAAYGALNLPSQKVKDLILDQAKS